MKKNLIFNRFALLLLSLFFLLGCKDDGDDKDDDGTDTDTNSTDVTSTDSSGEGGEVEIYSWWTSPGEAEALDALLAVFIEEYPDVSVVNVSKTFEHGEQARENLIARMADNDPPDTFQLGPRDFQTWVEYAGDETDNRLEALDTLFAAEGWETKYPAGVLEALKYGGNYYSVPVNMHRQNAMFYNKELVPEPPTTMEQFLTMAEELDGKGIVPLAISSQTWILQIVFFSMMSGTAGAEYHNDFFTGKLDLTKQENLDLLTETIANYETILSYANTDANDADFGWDKAAQKLVDNKAAMFIHGDWAKGYLISKGWVAGTDFDAVASPGTSDEFIYNVDTFALCKDAPNRDVALKFLRTIGSAPAQGAFNKIKGSTPVHPEVDVSSWDSVAVKTAADYKVAKVVHNVEIHTFSLPNNEDGSAGVGLDSKLGELFNKEDADGNPFTADDLVTWITTNYDAAAK
jgi:glucose/mannose transport system substrate-binding protein